MATVLITGGTGFIGSNLAMRLLERDKDTKVVLFDRNPDLSRLATRP
jgi:nucleoside-diphosphate-sugar epimerase